MDTIIKQAVSEELRKPQETKEGASKSSESNEGSSASTNGSKSRMVNRQSFAVIKKPTWGCSELELKESQN